MKYKVIEVSELTVTPKGKELKKLTLKGENESHLEERVTMWSDSDNWNCKVGDEIQATIDKKDSGTPIPAHPEKNYVNRTLMPEMNDNGTIAVSGGLEARVKSLEDWRDATSRQDGDAIAKEDINPDNIPF